MPTQQSKPLTGIFDNIHLDCMPQFPPLPLNERSTISPNYPTELAYLLFLINNQHVTEAVSSTYIMLLLDHLLDGLDNLISGQIITVESYSDPWQYDLRGVPAQDTVYITIQIPDKIVVMQDVGVPLSQFGREVVKVARKWNSYLIEHYLDEITDPEKDKQYQLFLKYLGQAKENLHEYTSNLSKK